MIQLSNTTVEHAVTVCISSAIHTIYNTKERDDIVIHGAAALLNPPCVMCPGDWVRAGSLTRQTWRCSSSQRSGAGVRAREGCAACAGGWTAHLRLNVRARLRNPGACATRASVFERARHHRRCTLLVLLVAALAVIAAAGAWDGPRLASSLPQHPPTRSARPQQA